MKDSETPGIFPDVIDMQKHNRYNMELKLLKIEGTETQYRLSDSSYTRYSPGEDDLRDVNWIDPSGGPFMTVGYKVTDTLEIVKLELDLHKSDFVITLGQIKEA